MKMVRLEIYNKEWNYWGKPTQKFLRYRGVTPEKYEELKKHTPDLKFMIHERRDDTLLMGIIRDNIIPYPKIEEIDGTSFYPPYDGKLD